MRPARRLSAQIGSGIKIDQDDDQGSLELVVKAWANDARKPKEGAERIKWISRGRGGSALPNPVD